MRYCSREASKRGGGRVGSPFVAAPRHARSMEPEERVPRGASSSTAADDPFEFRDSAGESGDEGAHTAHTTTKRGKSKVRLMRVEMR